MLREHWPDDVDFTPHRRVQAHGQAFGRINGDPDPPAGLGYVSWRTAWADETGSA
jgi:hypothetical protein